MKNLLVKGVGCPHNFPFPWGWEGFHSLGNHSIFLDILF